MQAYAMQILDFITGDMLVACCGDGAAGRAAAYQPAPRN